MTDFLSDEWIAALDSKLRASGRGSSPTPLTIQYHIATDGEAVAYHLVLGPGRDRAIVGTAADPQVTFHMDAATARQISDGELSTEEAFITGSLRIEGDPMPLMEAHRASDDA